MCVAGGLATLVLKELFSQDTHTPKLRPAPTMAANTRKCLCSW